MAQLKRIRRLIKISCPDCYGTGRDGSRKDGKCQGCGGKKEVEPWIVEIVGGE